MAKFFVGQMVRIIRTNRYPHLLGAEARVIDLGVTSLNLDGSLVDGCVKLDIPAPGFPGRFVAPPPDWLEPIVPDGHRAGEEGTCEPLDKLLSEVRDREAVK